MPVLFLFLCITLAAQPPDTFAPAAEMSVALWAHSATLLQNGKVLIAGGDRSGPYLTKCEGTAELYDPVSDTISPAGKIIEGRTQHSATLLADGRVLIAGGYASRDLDSAEVYEPSTRTFTTTGKLSTAISNHSALLQPDGKVFLAGGRGSMQVYDPEAGTFSQITDPGPVSQYSKSLQLTNLKVLTTVGSMVLNTIYDPGTQSLTFPENQANYRKGVFSTVTLMPDGNVLITGGSRSHCEASGIAGIDSLHLFDPVANRLWGAGKMAVVRVGHTATLLPDGDVFLAGGAIGCFDEELGGGGNATAETFNASNGRISLTSGKMLTARAGQMATLLRDGRVWIAGGYLAELTTEYYIPRKQIPAPEVLTVDGGQSVAVINASGRLLTADAPTAPGDIVVAYLESQAERSQIPPFVIARGRPAEVLYFGKVPGYESLNQINFRIPAATLPGAAVSLSIRELGRPSHTVSIPVR